MRYEIKSIGIWAYLKIAFFLNLLIGFVGGVFFAMFMSFQLAVMENMGLGSGPGFPTEDLPFGVLLVIMPIMFAIGGAIFYTLFGLIFVAIYNLVARITGGFEMELRAVEPPAPIQPVAPTMAPAKAAHWQPAPPPPPPAPQSPPPPSPTTEPPPPSTDEHRPPGPSEPPPPAGDQPR